MNEEIPFPYQGDDCGCADVASTRRYDKDLSFCVSDVVLSLQSSSLARRFIATAEETGRTRKSNARKKRDAQRRHGSFSLGTLRAVFFGRQGANDGFCRKAFLAIFFVHILMGNGMSIIKETSVPLLVIHQNDL